MNKFISIHKHDIKSINITPDDCFIVSLSKNGMISVYAINHGHINTFKPKSPNISITLFDNDKIFVIDRDGTRMYYDINGNLINDRISRYEIDWFNRLVSTSYDKKYVIMSNIDSVSILNTSNHKIDYFNYKNIRAKTVGITPNNKYAVIGYRNNDILIYDIIEKKVVKNINDFEDDIKSILLTYDSNYMIVVSSNYKIKTINIKTGICKKVSKTTHKTHSATISHDSKYVVIANTKKKINIFSIF